MSLLNNLIIAGMVGSGQKKGGPIEYPLLNTYGSEMQKTLSTLDASFETPAQTIFSPTGHRGYVVEAGGRKRTYEFYCSTPFQVSDWVQQSTPRQPGFITEGADLDVKSDGSRMWWSGPQGWVQYDLNTPWELSAFGMGTRVDLAKPAAHSNVKGFSISPDGTTMIAGDATNNLIHKYTLSTAYDISSATIVQSEAIPGPGTFEAYIHVGTDGRNMVSTGTVTARQYSMDPAWDLSTLTDLGVAKDTRSGGSNFPATGVWLSPDAKYFFHTNLSNDSVSRFTAA